MPSRSKKQALLYSRFSLLARPAICFQACVHQARGVFPGVKFTFLCPTLGATQLLQNLELAALHIHRNAIIDDQVYRPDPDAKKQFTAVHIANLATWKRHHLEGAEYCFSHLRGLWKAIWQGDTGLS
jgi:hypothetical protein